jgi:hypothetical protein
MTGKLGEAGVGRSLNRQKSMALSEQLLCDGQAKAAGCPGDDGDM